jgi:hypothetical protein
MARIVLNRAKAYRGQILHADVPVTIDDADYRRFRRAGIIARTITGPKPPKAEPVTVPDDLDIPDTGTPDSAPPDAGTDADGPEDVVTPDDLETADDGGDEPEPIPDVDAPLSVLNLDETSLESLNAAGYVTVGQLIGVSARKLQDTVPGVGRARSGQIAEAVAAWVTGS